MENEKLASLAEECFEKVEATRLRLTRDEPLEAEEEQQIETQCKKIMALFYELKKSIKAKCEEQPKPEDIELPEVMEDEAQEQPETKDRLAAMRENLENMTFGDLSREVLETDIRNRHAQDQT